MQQAAAFTPRVDNNGRMSRLAFCDKLARYFDTHPITGVRFEGFEIPFFNEAVDLCKRAAMVVPGSVCWLGRGDNAQWPRYSRGEQLHRI